jgi:hypothetical protein
MNNMKNYKKLTIPNEPIWDRKTPLAWLRRNVHWRIRYFIVGCKNVVRWVPTIFKDRNWDGWFIYNILQKKIEYQREEIIYANRHVDVDRDNRDMTIVLNLLERVKEDYYGVEYIDYYTSNYRFEPIEGKEELYSLEEDLISERYDEFLKKYPSTVRKVLKEKSDLDKKTLCHHVAQYNQEKAHNLLFKILKERMEWWWD